MAAGDLTDEDLAEVEANWATEIGERLKGIVDGTEVGVPHAEVIRRFGLPLGDQ